MTDELVPYPAQEQEPPATGTWIATAPLDIVDALIASHFHHHPWQKLIAFQVPRVQVTTASIIYTLNIPLWGNMGTVTLRKLNPRETAITINRPVFETMADLILMPEEPEEEAGPAAEAEREEAYQAYKLGEQNLKNFVYYLLRALRAEMHLRLASTDPGEPLHGVISTPRGGRPRNADDDWAFDQVRVQGRNPQAVFSEWIKRIGNRADLLVNPRESFRKAISPRRARKKR